MSALESIAAVPPSFSPDAVADAVDRQFGYRGELRPLVSERDQNFCLLTTDGCRYLVKVTSAAETATATQLQVGVLQHLERAGDIIVPNVIPALNGDACGRIENADIRCRLRMLSWVDGEQLGLRGIDAGLAGTFGRALGGLDKALAGFVYEGENPVLVWDLQRIGELRPVLQFIDDAKVRARVETAVDDFERFVAPRQKALPHQVIHADANPDNVLARDGGIGFIDFSDIVRAPRCFDPGIAASYLRTDGDDPLELVRPFMAGYHAVAALEPSEIDAMFDIVRARLATSIALLYWRLQDRPADDEYRQKSLQSESNASHFLTSLDAVGRHNFTREINYLCFSDANT
jgi:Ser/Thr protein kinase RdoA (MazF antagonist)